MALPPLPAPGADWSDWGAAVHNGVNGAAVVADIGTTGTATGDALRAAFGTPRTKIVGGQLVTTYCGPHMSGKIDYTWAGGARSWLGATYRIAHRVAVTSTNLQLVFTNFLQDYGAAGELNSPTQITVKATIEVGGTGAFSTARGTLYPVTFGGRTSATIDPNGVTVCDPLGVDVPQNTALYVVTYVTVPATDGTAATRWPGMHGCSSSRGEWVSGGGNPGTDLTTSTSVIAATPNEVAYGPYAITGTPTATGNPAIWVPGDSNSIGRSDTGLDENGYIRRGLADQFPVILTGTVGEEARHWAAAGAHRRRGPLGTGIGCRVVIDGYGVNDITNAATSSPAVLNGLRLTNWKQWAALGLKVFAPTITPRTSDGAGTTPFPAWEALRVPHNDWLRDGAPILNGTATTTGSTAAGVLRAGQAGHPLSGYFEVSDPVETARNSGIFKTGYTTDGVHLSQAGATAAAAGIDRTVLAAA